MSEYQPKAYDPNDNQHWVQIREHIEAHGAVPGALYDADRSQRGSVVGFEQQVLQGDANGESSQA